MNDPEQSGLPAKGQFLIYQAENGQVKIDVRLQGETAWLTQAHMAELFQTTIPNVNMHLRNIFADGELPADSVIKEFLTTAADGKQYRTNHYNLDAIISVGYRVKSALATREFYIRKTIEHGWSRSVLVHQLDTELHKRIGKAPTNFALIRSKGDQARFGKSTQAMKAQWKVPDNRPLADFAPTIILKAKDFAAEITIFKTREHGMKSESAISREHITNNDAARKTLLSRDIRPESLQPAEDVKKVERRLASEEIKPLKSPDGLDSAAGE